MREWRRVLRFALCALRLQWYSRRHRAIIGLLLMALLVGNAGHVSVASAAEPFAPPPGMVPVMIGTSVQGRSIEGLRMGWGPRKVVITGAIHGSEGNTAVLVHKLIAHFATIQHLVPPDVSVYFLPVLNPDGLLINSRYNARGVDLNRNWDSEDWQPDTMDSSGRVHGGGGTAPFSEPETAMLAAWLLDLRDQSPFPVTTVFYHSQYPPNGLVMPGSAGLSISRAFAAIVRYPAMEAGTTFSGYRVTGTAPAWCGRHQIRCFEIELPTQANVSLASMLRHADAILSVLLWEQTQPDQRCFRETGMCIAGRLLRFWEQNGGLETFGLPLTRQQAPDAANPDRQMQWFERARLELHPENAAPADVKLGRIGVEYLEQQGRDWWLFERSTPQDGCLFFAETEKNICGPFLATWQAYGLELDGRPGITVAESLALFGLPLSDAQVETLSDGQTCLVQWFERARFELPLNTAPTDRAQISLLGTRMQALE